ncbi:MAG: thermonuclease family protein [Deltaproteobacteria bacterium]|nr:thermonuclease family protein [Deltaproteobacteria bacterium]
MSRALKYDLCTVALLGLLLAASLAWAGSLTVEVARINDGDTITVHLRGKPELVRLIGVDAPETAHSKSLARKAKNAGRSATEEAKAGAASREAMRKLVAVGDKVRLVDGRPQTRKRDRYRRLLAFVYLSDGRLLNQEMIAQGWAHAYRSFNYRHKSDFLKAENGARLARRGLWAKGQAYDLERRTRVSPFRLNSRP